MPNPKQRKRIHSQGKTQAWHAQRTRNFRLALTMLAALTGIGTCGYMLIEGWNLREALYMTVITLSTVGFGEVKTLSAAGQVFSIILILTGVCFAAYSFSMISRVFLEGELNRFRGIIKMNKKIASFKKHFIVCGYGRLARFVISDLQERKEDVVVIENDTSKINDLEFLNIPYIQGNAYEDDSLKAAGIEKAQALLALLPNDPDNVYVTLAARNLNKNIKIMARTESFSGEDKLKLAGANQMIAPYRVSGSRVVQQLLHPHVNDFLQIVSDDSEGEQLALEQVIVPKDCPIAGKTLKESNLRSQTGVTIAAWINSDGSKVLSPQPEDIIQAGASVIAIGTQNALERLCLIIENN